MRGGVCVCTSCTTRITRTALFLPLEGGAKKRLRSSKTTAPYCGPRLQGTGSQRQLVSTTCRQNRSFVTGGADKARQQLRGGGSRPFRGTALPPVGPSVPSAPRAREHCWRRERALETRAPQLRAVLVQSVVASKGVGRAVACFCPAAAWQFSADQLCLCVRPAAGQEGPVLLQNLLNCQSGF